MGEGLAGHIRIRRDSDGGDIPSLERFPTGCMGSVSVFLDGQALRIHMCHTSE
jgi:hypothetical protein